MNSLAGASTEQTLAIADMDIAVNPGISIIIPTYQECLNIQHIRRLYIYRFANAMHLLQFLAVGAVGVVVNLTVLTVLLFFGLAESICLAGGIAVSVGTNFLLNRRFTFSYARDGRIDRQFIGYLGASSVGLLVNYGVALFMNDSVLPDVPYSLHVAATAGIASGMIFNFIGNRYFVFRKRHVRK